MLPNLLFWSLAIAAWAIFRYTTRRQRLAIITEVITLSLFFGAGGLVWEIVQRGGRLPIAW